MVGSSRNSRSGSPASAQASDSRCFWPPDSLPTQLRALALELDDLQQLVDRPAAAIERAEQAQRLLDRQLLAELRFLQLDAEPLPQLAARRVRQRSPSTSTSPASGASSPSRISIVVVLPAPFGTEQAEALAAPHVQRQPVHRDDVAVAFLESVTLHREFVHAVSVSAGGPRLKRRLERPG